ncbi:MAG: SpoIIE family protein phosphatase, partial [Anaerolineae bacterium]
LPAQPRYISPTPPRSAMFIPLVSGEKTIGMVSAQSQQPNRFDDEDLRRLMILANQAAAAIAHAQLYEQERRRATQLELVSQIARKINLIRERETLLPYVVRLTSDRFGFNPVTIFTLEAATGHLIAEASSETTLTEEQVCVTVGDGLVGTAASEMKTLVVNNTEEDGRFIQNFTADPAQLTGATRAEMAIPLNVAGEMLGVLDVQSAEPGVFTSAEKTALEALAAEIATAIDQARQLEWQREQAWITTAQFQVARAFSQSSEMDDLLTAVTRLTPMLVGVEFCGVLLWQEELNVYQGKAAHGLEQAATQRFNTHEFPIGDWTALDAVHVGRQMITTQTIPGWLQEAMAAMETAVHQLTLFPLHTKTRWLGVMVVNELEPEPHPNGRYGPGPRRTELLQNILNQSGQAIENVYLRDAQEEEAWVNTALLQVAEAVNSLIDLNEILNTIVRLVPMLVGVESSLILIWDEERQVFTPGPSHGISSMGRGLLATLELERKDLPAMSHQPADSLTPHGRYYDLKLTPWLEKVLSAPAAFAFPLHARGQLVGVLIVGAQSDYGRTILSSRAHNILNGIAHQAATAVVNNQLYLEAAERDKLEQELNVAREIQASFIPDGSPDIPGCAIASYWQAARQVSGDFYDFLQLPNGHWGILIADVADKGVPAALFMALSRTILRTVALSRTDPAETLIRANEIINHDSHSDLFVTVFYAIWDPENSTLSYANGGHNPPLILRRNGKARLLQAKGIALGVLPNIKIESHATRLRPGDTLLFYTDGVTEAMNEDYDEFGMERLRVTASAAHEEDAGQIVQAITRAIRDHAGDTPQFDDITLVVMKHVRP